MRKRPFGITIIAIIFIVLAAISFLWSLMVFGVGGISAAFGGLFGADNIAAFGQTNTWSGFVGILAAMVQIVAAIGLFLMKKWAWYLAVLAIGLDVVQGAFGLFQGSLFTLMCGGLLLLIPIGLLLYMLSGRIRTLFGIT